MALSSDDSGAGTIPDLTGLASLNGAAVIQPISRLSEREEP